MKTSSIVLLIIGSLLVLLQFGAYNGDNFEFPPLYNGDDFVTNLTKNSATILGYNTFGILGLVLVIIALTRKSKSD